MSSVLRDNRIADLADSGLQAQLRRFGSVPMVIEVESQRTTLTVAELLDLRPGSVIRMKRPPELLTLYTGGVGFAKGQISARFGKRMLRITAISQRES